MALGIKPLPSGSRKGHLRGEQIKSFVFTPDASKPSAGYTILASALGLSYLDFGVCANVNDGSLAVAGIKIGTASTDATLQFYSFLSSSAGVVAAYSASDTKLTTNPVSVLVIGR